MAYQKTLQWLPHTLGTKSDISTLDPKFCRHPPPNSLSSCHATPRQPPPLLHILALARPLHLPKAVGCLLWILPLDILF